MLFWVTGVSLKAAEASGCFWLQLFLTSHCIHMSPLPLLETFHFGVSGHHFLVVLLLLFALDHLQHSHREAYFNIDSWASPRPIQPEPLRVRPRNWHPTSTLMIFIHTNIWEPLPSMIIIPKSIFQSRPLSWVLDHISNFLLDMFLLEYSFWVFLRYTNSTFPNKSLFLQIIGPPHVFPF